MMFALKDSKIIIECYIYEPTLEYKPDNFVHEIYIFKTDNEWRSTKKPKDKFFKLSGKPYRNYKNKFDK